MVAGGPVLAHEVAPPASPPAAGAAGAAGAVAAPTAMPAAMPEEGLPIELVATAGALVLAIGALTAGMAVRRRRPTPAQAAAAALALTGAAHMALTPSHWAEGWHLGLFFAGAGVLLLGEALTLWRRPSVRAYTSVLVTTTVLIGAYFVAREVALPLVGHQEPYRFEDVPAKAAEVVAGGLALAALLPRLRTAYGESTWIAARSWASRRAYAPPSPTRP